MAFGLKILKLKCTGSYTLDELYEKIKDVEFEAGKPEIVKHGLAYIIAFPALDSHNQVQIIPGTTKKQHDTFTVMKAEAAGLSNTAGNMLLEKLTGGLFGMKSVMGKNAKEIEKLVESTHAKLETLGL